MRTERLAVVQGWADTRGTLRRWNDEPAVVLRPWALASLAVGVLLLAATWAIAALSTPDPSGATFPGVTGPATLGDFGFVLFRNGLVLALHALACVAGFMAGSSLPQVAAGYRGVWRTVHEQGRPAGDRLRRRRHAVLARHPGVRARRRTPRRWPRASASPRRCSCSGYSPHALPELFALFLPLAAWTLASRGRRWEELLAATFVTVAIAIPILLLAARRRGVGVAAGAAGSGGVDPRYTF